mgnify:CR=1 FL=1
MPLVIPPAGLSPLGAWTPPTAAARSTRHAWLVDPTGAATRDLTSMAGVGGTSAGDVVDEMVKFALLTVRGSGAAVQSDGQRLGDLRTLDDQIDVRIQSEVRLAMSRLTTRHLIRLDQVAVTTGQDWFEVEIRYENLRRQSDAATTQRHRYAIGRRLIRRVA